MAAEDLVRQAQQKLKPGVFGFLTGGPKYDDACDLYSQAAIQYKLAKNWQQAAECYAQCAGCARHTGSVADQANYQVEAGNVMKKISTTEAVAYFEQAVAGFNAAGRFGQSAKLLMQIAELYEAERMSHKEAREYYRRAAEMFDMDDHGKSNLTKCNLKVAEYMAKDGEYLEAVKIFEDEGNKALQNNLLQYNAKEHFLKAGILHLVMGDTVTINNKVEEYRSADPRFGPSREGELLSNLAEAFENRDVEAFTEKLGDYDAITKLDAWKTDLLVKVKDAMEQPDMDPDLT